jgi:hypothetical protein
LVWSSIKSKLLLRITCESLFGRYSWIKYSQISSGGGISIRNTFPQIRWFITLYAFEKKVEKVFVWVDLEPICDFVMIKLIGRRFRRIVERLWYEIWNQRFNCHYRYQWWFPVHRFLNDQ